MRRYLRGSKLETSAKGSSFRPAICINRRTFRITCPLAMSERYPFITSSASRCLCAIIKPCKETTHRWILMALSTARIRVQRASTPFLYRRAEERSTKLCTGRSQEATS